MTASANYIHAWIGSKVRKLRNTVFKDYVNLREVAQLETNEHLVDLSNQVAEDIGININEEDEEDEEEDLPEEHETDKHETVDVVTRKNR